MRSNSLRLAVLALVSLGSMVLLPSIVSVDHAQNSAKSACPQADLRASIAEALAATRAAEVEACKLRLDMIAKENTALGVQVGDVGNKLAAEQSHSAVLVDKNSQAEDVIAERDRTVVQQGVTIAAMIIARDKAIAERDKALVERDYLRFKVNKANGTAFCEFFHLGCVSFAPSKYFTITVGEK